MLKKEFIQPSVIFYESLVLFVKKYDESMQLCIDFGVLNQQTCEQLSISYA